MLGPLLQVEMSKKCTPLWREARFEVKTNKTPGSDHFWKLYKISKKCTWLWCEAHFEVKILNTPCSDHFWKLRCRKSARPCGAKRISKSNRTKRTRPGPLLEVEMSRKCTPLWREAHFQVKRLKAPGVRTTFGRSDVVSRGMCKGLCTLSKVSKM